MQRLLRFSGATRTRGGHDLPDPSLAHAVSQTLHGLAAQEGSRQVVGAVRAHVDGLLHHDAGALESAVAGYRNTGRPLALAAACEDLAELTALFASFQNQG